jgi:hypothetical protein
MLPKASSYLSRAAIGTEATDLLFKRCALFGIPCSDLLGALPVALGEPFSGENA